VATAATLSLLITPGLMISGQANSAPKVLFSELLTKGQSGQKFIELYNLSDEPVELNGWKIQRTLSCSGAASSTTVVALKAEIQPRGNFLIAKAGTADEPDIEHSLTNLCADYGQLKLVDPTGFEHDAFGWGAGASAVDSSPLTKQDSSGSAVAFTAGESFKRRTDEDGHFIDSGDSFQDFFISSTPSPESTRPPLLSGDEFEPSTGNIGSGGLGLSGSVESATDSAKSSAKLAISELFIDPDKPLTDADDEFVELFNPTKETVDLEDYKIQTGAEFSYSFTLPSIVIKPGQYLALFSIDTSLTLSNSGGAARLMGPDGKLVYEVPAYGKAKPNTAWADIGGRWQWTSQPTPNKGNILSAEGANSNSGTTTNSGRVLAASADADGRNIYQEPPAAPTSQVNTAVVAGVGTMALLYAGYEYRYDLGNRLHQFKRYFKSRRGGGTKA